jgi:hypothetical protein
MKKIILFVVYIFSSFYSYSQGVNNKMEIKMYPNPITDNQEITFTYPSLGDKSSLLINNTEGKEVFRYELPCWSSIQHVRIPKLSGGIYLTRFISKGFSANVKFLVQ